MFATGTSEMVMLLGITNSDTNHLTGIEIEDGFPRTKSPKLRPTDTNKEDEIEMADKEDANTQTEEHDENFNEMDEVQKQKETDSSSTDSSFIFMPSSQQKFGPNQVDGDMQNDFRKQPASDPPNPQRTSGTSTGNGGPRQPTQDFDFKQPPPFFHPQKPTGNGGPRQPTQHFDFKQPPPFYHPQKQYQNSKPHVQRFGGQQWRMASNHSKPKGGNGGGFQKNNNWNFQKNKRENKGNNQKWKNNNKNSQFYEYPPQQNERICELQQKVGVLEQLIRTPGSQCATVNSAGARPPTFCSPNPSASLQANYPQPCAGPATHLHTTPLQCVGLGTNTFGGVSISGVQQPQQLRLVDSYQLTQQPYVAGPSPIPHQGGFSAVNFGVPEILQPNLCPAVGQHYSICSTYAPTQSPIPLHGGISGTRQFSPHNVAATQLFPHANWRPY